MTICNVCTLNLRQANCQLKNDEALRERVNDNLETVGAPPYSGGVEVKHLLWLIAEGEGYERLKEVAHKGLKGLKVAPFYGCQILRPSKLLGFEDPDRPWSLEAIIEACGGEAIDYPAKIKCCGFPIIQAREDAALGELIQPIEQAIEAGADAMVTPCPLCHLSLDAWQSKLEARPASDFQMPILHLSQLIGVAAGLEESELKFKRHVVPVTPVRRSSRSTSLGGPPGRAAGRASCPRRDPPALANARSCGSCRGRRLGAAAGGCSRRWLRLQAVEVDARRASAELDGLRSLHLSDFHLGTVSSTAAPLRGRSSGPSGGNPISSSSPATPARAARCRAAARCALEAARSTASYAVLGNHDFAISRDPFSSARRSSATASSPTRARLSTCAGGACRSPAERSACPTGKRRATSSGWRIRDADLRILLFHYPDVDRWLPPASFDLVLAGTCTADRSACRCPAASFGSRTCARTLGGAVPPARRDAARLARARDDLRPVPASCARPEATELAHLRCPTGSHRAHGGVHRRTRRRLPRLRLVAVARPQGGAKAAGSSGSRTSGAPGGRSTSTTTSGCSA